MAHFTDEFGVGADFIRCGEAREPWEGNLVVLGRDRQVLHAQRLFDEGRLALNQMVQVGNGLIMPPSKKEGSSRRLLPYAVSFHLASL